MRSLLTRLSRSSRGARSAVLKRAATSATSFSISAVYGWAAINPMDTIDSTSVTSGARLFDRIARSPDPHLRFSVDSLFVLLFAVGGVIALTRFAPVSRAR